MLYTFTIALFLWERLKGIYIVTQEGKSFIITTHELSNEIQISTHIGLICFWSMKDWGSMSDLVSHEMSLLGGTESQFIFNVLSTRLYNSN